MLRTGFVKIGKRSLIFSINCVVRLNNRFNFFMQDIEPNSLGKNEDVWDSAPDF